MIDSKPAVANTFNDYFINIAHELMLNTSNTNTNSCIIFLDNRNNISMFLLSIAGEELIGVVTKFRSKKSSDCDEFSMELIKKVIYLISKPLTNMFNKSFATVIFHEEMKIAKVIPVFKTGKKYDL